MRRTEMITRSGAATAVWAAALLLAVCLPAAPALAAEGSCSNEARRAEQASTYLSNCRAYELVTPAHEDSGEPEAGTSFNNERPLFEPIDGAHGAANGERMAWISASPGLAGGSSPGLDYLSTRDESGQAWVTEATVPPQSPESGLLCPVLIGMLAWSPNLTKGILADGDSQAEGGFSQQNYGCGHAEPALMEADGAEIEEPQGFQNLFVRSSGTGFYQLVNVTPSTAPHPTPVRFVQIYNASSFLAGSTDLEHVAFEDELPLTEEAEKLSPAVEAACKEEPKGRACWEGHDDLYVWSEGRQPAVRLVSIMPDGKPGEGRLAGSTKSAEGFTPHNMSDYQHAVSGDGSRIFFESEGRLYVRENAYAQQSAAGECTEAEQKAEPEKACTIQLDAKQGGAGEGGGQWLGASEDGARVFFTDEQRLTGTATAESGKPDLYEYDFEAPPGKRLTDLTVDATEPADVQGVSAISQDGSYIYFVAKGKLVGKQKLAGRSPEESEPTANADNLYVSHEGTIAFIATLTADDDCDWTSDAACYPMPANNPGPTMTARLSDNGRYFAFNSSNQLTSYHNAGPNCVELREPTAYVAGSCEEIYLYEAAGNHLACASCNPNGAPSADGATIDWAAGPDSSSEPKNGYPQRNVSETGQVFFETSEALLPQQDVNGVRDVYEYEHETQRLISSGTSSAPSYFMDASADGSNVFFATAQPLVESADSGVYGIYDARVGGGFRAQEESVTAPPCQSLEGCHSPLSEPPAAFSVASATLVASGNLEAKQPEVKAEEPKKKKAAKQKRAAKLAGALKQCARRYRHSRRKRSVCKQRARRQFSPQTKATRHHGGAK